MHIKSDQHHLFDAILIEIENSLKEVFVAAVVRPIGNTVCKMYWLPVQGKIHMLENHTSIYRSYY